MRYANSQERPLRSPEIAFNLWAYSDESGAILRIACKAYILDGSDEEKLAKLKALAVSDFLCATWDGVPKRFTVSNDEGRKLEGYAHASILGDPASHWPLFGQLIEQVADDLPTQVRSVNGEYQQFKLPLPESPLTVTTLVLEREDGTQIPLVS